MKYIFFLYSGEALIGSEEHETDNPAQTARKLRKGNITRVEWEES